jgi:two-component system, response regulator YesN
MESASPRDFRIQAILQTIESDPTESVRDLAQRVNLSSSRLSHLFKAKMGLSLTIFLAERRMEKAADLLRSTEMRIKEITFIVGYQQEPSFVRAFRKKFECTPTSYRHQQRLRLRNSRAS